ncbi:MAG: DNA double-strand break repair nuclease NurA [Nitrososphaerota archaeon]
MHREGKKIKLERLPSDFREQYFSMFQGVEPETLHPDLYQRLIDDGTDMIIRKLKEYNERRKALIDRVREKIKVVRLQQNEKVASMRVVASDAGNNGVDLRSAFVPLYASAALAAEGWTIIDEPIFRAGEADIWSDEFRVQDRESLLASKIQVEITEEAIEQFEPRMVFFDGTLLIHFWLLPFKGTTGEFREDFNETIMKMIGLLHTCYERDIPIVGFVKRTRINHICTKFGIPKLRDTALMDLILRLGEYTIPESEPMTGQVVKMYKRGAEKFGIPPHIIEKITNIHSSYIRTGLTTPFRLEIPEYCLGRLEEIGTVLLTTSEEEGLPFVINEADRLTKVTASVSNIRTLMIYSKALDLVRSGEMEPDDLRLLALQHGEEWAIHDEGYLSSVPSDQGGG